MDTVLLRTFLEVSKTRHFGRAADNLFITHSAVSSRIRQLEQTIGAKVFDRKRNDLRLTPAGERLIPYAEGILSSWQMALQDVGVSSEQRDQVTIGATSSIWDLFLQKRLPMLADSHPALAMRTDVTSQVLLVRSVMEGLVDLALVFDPPKSPEVTVIPVMEMVLVLAAHQAGLSFSQLPEQDYLFIDWGATFSVQHAKLFDQPVVPILHTGQSQVALEFLLHKGGTAFLPEAMLEASADLYPVEGSPRIERQIYAIFQAQSEKQALLNSITRALTD
ncbi:LysR family transcriptional regulator [Motiliproteus sp.]|uniref:LysR family transcriptional regulator n=1 Tax=Motiliproteus sp. TaxID=1898955 RepID=UPI003BABEB0F